jgi:Flp pilus assembly protein protease CpaA
MMLLNIIVIIIFLAIASVFDLKRKTVPGWMIVGMIGVGVLHSLFFISSLSGQGIFQYFTIIFACAIVVFGIIFDKLNFLGMGDSLLLAGIVLLLPIELISFNFFLIFVILTGICAISYYIILIIFTKMKFDFNANIKFAPCICIGFIVAVLPFIGL